MLESCKEQNDNVILHRMKQNSGLPTALNTGIQIALSRKCDFIARMDADDIAMPDRLQSQEEKFRKNTKGFANKAR